MKNDTPAQFYGRAWGAMAPWMSGWASTPGQWPAVQQQMGLIMLNSAVTIGLRMMLAPPWMAHDPWVRKEWHDMTAEKGRAAFDAVRGATLAASWPWNSGSTSRIVKAAFQPYDSRTRSNAARLGKRALEPLRRG